MRGQAFVTFPSTDIAQHALVSIPPGSYITGPGPQMVRPGNHSTGLLERKKGLLPARPAGAPIHANCH